MTSPNAYLRNAHEFDGQHTFLAEELLLPMANRCDVARVNMFCQHLSQAVVLNRPERPRVFSRFENRFGRYTSAIRTMATDATVVSTFDRNPLQRVLAFEFEDGTVGIHFGAPVRHLTEAYGYNLDNSFVQAAEPGDPIPAGQIVQSWPCHDESGNFMYGANLKTVYMNYEGLTYEDGLVISESAAERMSHTSIEKITVTLNANDLTLDLYGEGGEYQGFPEVGQEIKNGVLLCRRRINHESILHDLSTPQLTRINWESDTPIYAEGTVVDIEIFSNMGENDLDRHIFSRQLLAHQRQWLAFQEWVLETFGPYMRGEKGRGYSNDVGFWYKVCRETAAAKWRNERKEFDGVVLRFTVAKSNPVAVGSKLTNRFGGKGVVSKILPDAEMPTTEDGRRADLVVNSLGVVNRLNPAQLFESELNFIADHVQQGVANLVASGSAGQAWATLIQFLEIVSPDQAKWLLENLGDEDRADLVQEIAAGEPIYIHQAPFFGNVPLEQLKEAYETFGVDRVPFRGVEEPMVLGTNYYMKLRHEPKGKHSARSAKHLSVNGVPAKNSKGVRTSTEHHSTTPIRFGEQEVQGLIVANQPEAMKRLFRLYATDDVSREGLIADLILRADPFSTARVEPRGSGITRPVAGLGALLESIGQRLVPGGDEEAPNVEIETEQETANDGT